MNTLFKKYADKIKTDQLSETDIIKLRSHLNGSLNSFDDVELNALHELVCEHEPEVTPEQSAKGIAWLRDQWKTPRGVERKNNPFGIRETDVLDSFNHFTLTGFYDSGRGGFHNYQPCYGVHGDKGSFEYVPYGCNWPTRKTVYIIG